MTKNTRDSAAGASRWEAPAAGSSKPAKISQQHADNYWKAASGTSIRSSCATRCWISTSSG